MQQLFKRPVVCGIILALMISTCSPQPSPTFTPAPTPTTFPTIAISSVIKPDVIVEIDAYLNQLSQDGKFTGSVLLARQGTILFGKGYGSANREQKIPNTPQTRFRIASITKQFTAMAILILQTQGKLRVQDLVCNYISDCPTAWQAITIHHLLTHTSGILNYTLLSAYDGTRTASSSHEEIMALFKNLPLYFQPGEKYSYSNSGYIVLGYIIERVSGMSYEAFLQQYIFTPLGMHDTGVTRNSIGVAAGYADGSSQNSVDWNSDGADGVLYSTVHDLYLWDQALYTEQLVPQAQLNQMFAPYVDSDFSGLPYGYGWFVGKYRERQIAFHPGAEPGANTVIARYPNERAVVIALGNQRKIDWLQIMNDLSDKIFDGK